LLSPRTPVSSSNKTDYHAMTEILVKMALHNITLTPNHVRSATQKYVISKRKLNFESMTQTNQQIL
jgi:hypothetical protein